MTRTEAREQAFILLFEMAVQDKSIEDVLEDAYEARDVIPDEYINNVIGKIIPEQSRIDEIITENIRGWSFSRLSKVTLSILRLSVYELLYMEEVPVSVSINEAVTLGKKYGDAKDSSYINGVLSAIEKKYCGGRKDD